MWLLRDSLAHSDKSLSQYVDSNVIPHSYIFGFRRSLATVTQLFELESLNDCMNNEHGLTVFFRLFQGVLLCFASEGDLDAHKCAISTFHLVIRITAI